MAKRRGKRRSLRRAVARGAARVRRFRRGTMAVRSKAGDALATVIHSGLAGGTAFGLGFWAGNQGKKLMLGPYIPIDLVVATGAHALGAFGVGGMERYFHAIGDGALSAWAVGMGVKTGAGRGGSVERQMLGAYNPNDQWIDGAYSYSEDEAELAGVEIV